VDGDGGPSFSAWPSAMPIAKIARAIAPITARRGQGLRREG